MLLFDGFLIFVRMKGRLQNLGNNLNALFVFSNIILKTMIQSTKFPIPTHWTREIKGRLVPLQVALCQRREDVSRFEKPEIGIELASEVLFRQKLRVLPYINTQNKKN